MQFDPATGGMKCPFCGQTQALATPPSAGRPAGIVSHALDEFIAHESRPELRPISAQALEVSCAGAAAR